MRRKPRKTKDRVTDSKSNLREDIKENIRTKTDV